VIHDALSRRGNSACSGREGDEWRGSVEEAEKQVAEGNLREVDGDDDSDQPEG
jgi:hypothetical protein